MNDIPPFNDRIRLRIGDPPTLAASVPHLLGFYPQDSLVLVTLRATDPHKLAVTVRVDLPPAEHYEMVARSMIEPLLVNDVGYAALVLVGWSRGDSGDPAEDRTGPEGLELPHQEFVVAVTGALAEARIEVIHSMWLQRLATGERWWCYDDADCSGELPDPRSTELAMAAVVSGDVILRDRDELVVMLEPVASDTLRRTEAALTRRMHETPSAGVPNAVRQLVDAMADAEDLTRPEASERVAELVASLMSADVRTACLSMAIDDRARDAERLWTALTKATPGPWRADPAVLLAVSAYARGVGALARVAVDVALAANPEHSFAQMLSHALQLGLPMQEFREILAASAATPAD